MTGHTFDVSVSISWDKDDWPVYFQWIYIHSLLREIMECHMIYESFFIDEKMIWIGRKWQTYIIGVYILNFGKWNHLFFSWKLENHISFVSVLWLHHFLRQHDIIGTFKCTRTQAMCQELYMYINSFNKLLRNAQLCPFLRNPNWGLLKFNRVDNGKLDIVSQIILITKPPLFSPFTLSIHGLWN